MIELPAPLSHDSSGPQRSGHRSGSSRIPSTEEILAQLIALNGAVALGILSPGQANVIHRNLRTVLDTQIKEQKGGRGSASVEALAALYRQDPQLLAVIEPFLSDEQKSWLLRHGEQN